MLALGDELNAVRRAGAVLPGSDDRAMPAKPHEIGTLLDVMCGMNVFERLERQICSLVAAGNAESMGVGAPDKAVNAGALRPAR